MKTLQEVRDYLIDIPDINAGGCAIAALTMYRWLKKHKKVYNTTKVVYLYHSLDEDSYDINCKYVKGESKDISSCTHAVLIHRKIYIDTQESSCWLNDHDNKHYLDEDFVVESINNMLVWNWCFDRQHIRTIEKDLGIDLSDITINQIS